nr:uncharacterized protein LOC123744999 [Procambarus clarkii]XP_045581202.1 uncharacterized protein LOC123744999 [Procambarus clarkii]XP_045581203.1 uncharacterized protein LOC123744999 [Procambarus clarkii]
MSEEISTSVRPNPYIFDIENRRKRKPRLAHDLGAGAKCNKCGDKCPGFELHFWRKICMNCRCGKDDHEVEDDDEDIGRIVIGKLFDRPPRTKKEELEYCHENHLDIVNEETGKTEKLKFDWVPPNVEKSLAARYMALLPPEKRPVAGSEAAKERRRQLEQQIPLYDMDEAQRCDNMPAEELQCFHAFLERIKTQVAGQGLVQEIAGAPAKSMAQPLLGQHPMKNVWQGSGRDSENNEDIGYRPDATTGDNSVYGLAPDNYILRNKNLPYVDDQYYRQPVGQPDNKRSSLRDKFIGEMIGDFSSVANSKLYGVAPQTSRPVGGIGADQHLDRVATGFSDLNIDGDQKRGISGRGATPGTDNILSQPYLGQGQLGNSSSQFNNNILGSKAFTPGQKSNKPGQHDNVPSHHSYTIGDEGQDTCVPHKQVPLSDEYINKGLPVERGYMANKGGYINTTGQQPYTPSKETTIHGYYMGTSEPGKCGLIPGQETYGLSKHGLSPGQKGYVPGTQGLLPGQEGYVADNEGLLPGQEGYMTGKQDLRPGQIGYVPVNQDQGLGQEGYVPARQGQQFYNPTKETTIHDYNIGVSEPTHHLSGQEAGVPYIMGNIGGTQNTMANQSRVPQQQMNAKNGNITSVEAVQAPYGARLDTMTGGMSLAPGTDVTVLFPGESQVIGSRMKSSNVPQKSKLTCQYCSLPMNVGDVAIFCERAGIDKCWHPACFCCYTCKELLADLIYFYKDGKVFCGRHFTDAADMPRCKSCDELIFGNSWTRADGFDWHIQHFCCNVCDTPMAGQRYVPDKDGYPYCLPCYMACLAKMCETCEEKIPPEENRCGHRGYFYHANPHCFRCYSCKDPLLGKRFKMSKNWLFCSNECIKAATEDLATNPNPKEKPQ